MAKVTLFFAAILIVLGAAIFIATGSHAITSLIPAVFGLALGVLGLLARSDDSKRRMFFMHIAVTIGLLGFLFPGAGAAGDILHLLRGLPVLHPKAMWEEELAMSLLCMVYVLLSVRSFIAVRRAR
ncbi:MAG: hypothetical protein ACP5EP_04585 [Acidobacteriaceae bacterium]